MADNGVGQDQIRDSGPGVLGRLLQARDQTRVDHGGAAALPNPQPVTATRAAGNAVARAVEGLYALPVSPLELTPAAITLAEMAEMLPRPALLSVVEGPGDAIGVVAICPALMTALIEVQTLGRITARAVEDRRATRSDAMICADFVNALLTQLGQEMTRIEGFEGFGGYRYASFLDDQRPLLLMLDDTPYRSLRFRLRLGGSPAREGEIFVALPQKRAALALDAPREATKSPKDGLARPTAGQGLAAVKPGLAPAAGSPGDPQLAQRMREAPIDVVGVLCRRRVRLGVLRSLRPGQILPLPRVELSETRLETRLGQVLAVGKLGEADGFHAIRLRGADEAAGDAPVMGVLQTGTAAAGAAPVVDRDAGRLRPDPATGEPPMADLNQPDDFRHAREAAAGGGVSRRPGERGMADSAATQQKSAISG